MPTERLAARLRRLAPAAVLLLLAGCETVPESVDAAPVPDPALAYEARQRSLLALPGWRAAGRVAFSTATEGWNASLRWAQSGEHYRIYLSGPLGQGAVELDGAPGAVTLRTSEPRTLVAADPEALLAQTLGWQLPLRGLRFWLTGVADPAVPADVVRLDPGGRLEYLEQSGWQVEYRDYTRAGALDMPSKVFMRNATTGSELDARVVVSSWEL